MVAYNCWAHARRYFFEAKDNEPEKAEEALYQIRQLYELERQLRGRSPDERASEREKKARPVLDRFKTWLKANGGLPRSPWGKAVSYALTRWDKLTRYVEDGRIEIDNNQVENAIQTDCPGEKELLVCWLSRRGTKRSGCNLLRSWVPAKSMRLILTIGSVMYLPGYQRIRTKKSTSYCLISGKIARGSSPGVYHISTLTNYVQPAIK